MTGLDSQPGNIMDCYTRGRRGYATGTVSSATVSTPRHCWTVRYSRAGPRRLGAAQGRNPQLRDRVSRSCRFPTIPGTSASPRTQALHTKSPADELWKTSITVATALTATTNQQQHGKPLTAMHAHSKVPEATLQMPGWHCVAEATYACRHTLGGWNAQSRFNNALILGQLHVDCRCCCADPAQSNATSCVGTTTTAAATTTAAIAGRTRRCCLVSTTAISTFSTGSRSSSCCCL